MSSTSRAPPANVQAAMMRLQQDAASASPFASAEAQQQSAPLPLFGQGDHGEEEDAPWTPRERWELGLRAAFLPRDSLDGLGLRRALTGAGLSLDVAGTAQKAAAAERVDDANAAAQTVTANKPAGKPVVVKGGLLVAAMRRAAFRLLLVGIRAGGAAFIKWGQWSATREDIFPEDLCQILSELHDRAPVHGWEASKREIEAAFGRSLEDLFVCIDQKPLASGSIAQVHRATMHIDGAPREVVVKVRHPGVARRIHQDFQLLKPLAAATSRVRSLKGLSLKESVSQFSHTMTAQADLRVEAAHLRRFYNNFAAVRNSVTPPYPLPGYETEAVLIETYEPGDSVSKYIRSPTPFNTKIVGLGVDTYLKMLLEDNFVHTDLHPGNILVRVRGQEGVGDGAGAEVRDKLQLILLDFGLAEELTPRVRKHFISFLHMITSGNGRLAAYHMLRFGRKQECPNPVAFADDMELLFRRDCNIHAPEGIDVDKVLKAVLHVARQHEVTIDSSYAALVIGVCIIVGFATSMDPRVNLLDAATPAFLYHQLTGQAQGRLYS
ncbi:hypothetical protein WJX72_004814 [[Myrmecia] bisecta]|uniref:Protein kinase domain-containing protein n=1 Tax=[Myrmecia] bisecta TaxID=41462 RepID=A0AAW1QEX0_9CHLO